MKWILLIPVFTLSSCAPPILKEENNIAVSKIESVDFGSLARLQVHLSGDSLDARIIDLPLSATVHVGDRVFWCEEEKAIKFLPPITEKE
jgi:hypothetical protein